MQKNLAFRLLTSLTLAEQKEFKRYIASPFFNRSQLRTQAAHLLIHHLQKHQCAPAKDQFFLKLFPALRTAYKALPEKEKPAFVGKKVDPLLNHLKRHLEDYIVWKANSDGGFHRDYLLVHELVIRNVPDLYLSYSKRVEKRFDEEEFMHWEYHHYKYKLLLDRYNYPGLDRVHNDASVLEVALSHLDRYFAAEKLNKAYILKGKEIMFKVASKIDLLEATLAYAQTLDPRDAIHVKTYYFLVRNLKRLEYDPAEFAEFKDLILSTIDLNAEMDRYAVFKTLLNYLKWCQIMQSADVSAELYALFLLADERNYLFESDRMNFATMYNYISSACDAGEYEAAEAWLRKNKEKLEGSMRENTFLFGLGTIYFEAGRFQDCLSALNQKSRDVNVVNKFQDKILRLKCAWEQREFALLEANLEATRKQLERDKILGSLYRQHLTNFLKYFRWLYKLKASREPIADFVRALEKEDVVESRDWLLAKVKEDT